MPPPIAASDVFIGEDLGRIFDALEVARALTPVCPSVTRMLRPCGLLQYAHTSGARGVRATD